MESTQPTHNPTQLPPPREKYREFDQIGKLLQQNAEYRLLILDGRFLEEKLSHTSKYDHFGAEGTRIPKMTCIGAFPPGYEALVVSTNHPIREISYARRKRHNQQKLWELYPEHRLGRTLRVILVNGWELVGSIAEAGQFYVALRLSETVVVYLYRHALADSEWVDGEPPPLSEKEAEQTQQQRFDLSYETPNFGPRVKKAKKGKATPASSAEAMKLLVEAIKKEVVRTMVNAKLKLVLREIPPTLQELGDIVWIPLENQSKGLPKGLELGPLPVDLVVSKKMWAGALKKAQELKQTGQKVLYVFEAMIGLFQNRFAAVASSVQVAEDKPKVR